MTLKVTLTTTLVNGEFLFSWEPLEICVVTFETAPHRTIPYGCGIVRMQGTVVCNSGPWQLFILEFVKIRNRVWFIHSAINIVAAVPKKVQSAAGCDAVCHPYIYCLWDKSTYESKWQLCMAACIFLGILFWWNFLFSRGNIRHEDTLYQRATGWHLNLVLFTL